MKKLKYILIITFVIIVIFSVMSFTSEKQDVTKKNEVNNLFSVWMRIAGTGDQSTLKQNEASIKKDLYDKLNSQEILSLKNYSMAVQNMMSVKETPFNPLFINSLAYLTQNFKAAKEIISKTNASSIFSNFGFGAVKSV